MKPTHIAMIISRFPPTIGGTEIQCRELSRALVKRGHRVSVLTEHYDSALPEKERIDGVDVYRLGTLGSPPLSSILFCIPLWRWLRAHPDVDILHAHMIAAPAIAALLFGKWLKKPVVIKTAGAGPTGDFGTSRRTLYGRFKLRLFKKWARYVACPSSITYKEAQSLGVSTSVLRLIPNGVDTERFHPLPENQRAVRRGTLKLKEGNPIAVFAGRWAPGKGVEELLEVWECPPYPGWTLCLLVNPPPSAAQLERLKTLGGRVEVRTNVSDPLPYYQVADLAVLLSENEGVSNFLLEAMACGLPVLTTPGAAVGSRADGEAAGWVMPSQDTEGLLNLLRALRGELTLRGVKGSTGRRQVTERFSTAKVAEAYEKLYEEALTPNVIPRGR